MGQPSLKPDVQMRPLPVQWMRLNIVSKSGCRNRACALLLLRGPRVAPTPQEVLMHLPEAKEARQRNIDDTTAAVQIEGAGVWIWGAI
eukprot:scaffold251176_cov17-Tisochrysis_lutea.AAC.2